MHWLDSGLTLIHFLVTNAQEKLQSPPDLSVPVNSSIDIKLLTEQINFLKDANSELHTTFNSFATTINTTVIVIGVLLTGITFFLSLSIGQNYRSTVKELKQEAKEKLNKIQSNLEANLSLATDKKIEQLKRLIRQEEVVHEAKVTYINTTENQPLEYTILKDRDFDNLTFSSRINKKEIKNKVVVLDLINLDLNSNSEKPIVDEIIKKKIDEIEQDFPRDSLLIIYCSPGIPRINQLLGAKTIRYVTIANNRITLVGAVVDSAYILNTVLV
jgi:CRISPR/Cas system CMR-associated protein Cmr5 small subunit